MDEEIGLLALALCCMLFGMVGLVASLWDETDIVDWLLIPRASKHRRFWLRLNGSLLVAGSLLLFLQASQN